MGTFVLALIIVGLLMAAMSVGVIFGRKPISGTCGGLGAMGGGACDICGGDTSKCEEENAGGAASSGKAPSLAYNAADAGDRPGH